MKILCTADWHIGKKIESFSRIDEQKIILNEIVNITKHEEVDVVIIAGDCFDTRDPSPEMAKIFMNILAQLSQGGKCLVLVISGNHDNPQFLSSAEAFSSQVGVVILGYSHEIPTLENTHRSWNVENSGPGMIEIYFTKPKKKIRFLLAPYADAKRLRKDLGVEDVDQKICDILSNQWSKNISHDDDVMNILVTHQYLLPEKRDQLIQEEEPVEDEGERSIVGTIGAMSLADFPDGIDYVIAGHIHKYQQLYSSKCKAYYTGSPLVYSLSESQQQKQVLILDLRTKNREYTVSLPKQRDIKEIRFHDFSTIDDILTQEKENYLILRWEGNRYFTAEEHHHMRSLHPYILRIESCPKISHDYPECLETLQEQSIELLFQEYFSSKNKGCKPAEDLLFLFRECINEREDKKVLQRKQGFLPKKLSIKGFYSYRELVEIDFTYFQEKNFFGIFGKTGSGKSALIEAMILVLFGRVERLGKLSAASKGYFKTYHSAMNINSPELLIEFIFEIQGVDGLEEYLCRMHSVRDKKNAMEFKKNKREFFLKDQDQWIPLDHSDGENILGIEYDDFRKTIVLQQQDFLGFISSDPKDTADTLKRLFQLERFDLQDSVTILQNEITKNVDILTMKLSKLDNVSEEWLEQYGLDKEIKEQKIIDERKSLSHIRDQLSKLRELLTVKNQWIEIQAEKKELDLQKQKFEQGKKRQSIIELIQKDEIIKDTLSKIAEINCEIAQLKTKHQEFSQLIPDLEKKCQIREEILQRIKLQLDDFQKLQTTTLSEELPLEIHRLQHYIKESKLHQEELMKLRQQISTLKNQLSLLSTVEQDLQEAEKVRYLSGLSTAVQYLKNNIPCPLCGSLDHPMPCTFDLKDIDESAQKFKKVQSQYHSYLEYKSQLSMLEESKKKCKQLFYQSLCGYDSMDSLIKKYEENKSKQDEQQQQRETITKKIEMWKKDLLRHESEYCILQKTHHESREEYSRLDEKYQLMNQQLVNEQRILENIQQQKIDLLEEQKLALDQYEEIKHYPILSYQEIETFFIEYAQNETKFQILSKSIKGIEDNDLENSITQLQNEEKESEDRLSGYHTSIGSLLNSISTITEQLKEKEALSDQQMKEEIRQKNVQLLSSLFKGQGFVKFIGNKYLYRLCHTANKRFTRFTQNQFEFSPPMGTEGKKDGKIVLIDRLSGGNQRDMLTLSGGQGFQAALALALALADESGAGHRFFFIDEGFGSLDEHTLSYVLETLSAIAIDEHRMVGVISHVAKIKEEVQACLNVTLDAIKGTQIEVE